MPASDALRMTPSPYQNFLDKRRIHGRTNTNHILHAIEPPGLSPAEKQVIKSYGGWTSFMTAFGLKPWKGEDAQEGLQIVRAFAQNNGDEE
jgi:hypothetical protein